MEENADFSKFLRNCVKDPRLKQFELSDLLIMPVQVPYISIHSYV